jgi:hypothetical protein
VAYLIEKNPLFSLHYELPRELLISSSHSPGGGIGRHTGLKILSCLNATCRFDSGPGHIGELPVQLCWPMKRATEVRSGIATFFYRGQSSWQLAGSEPACGAVRRANNPNVILAILEMKKGFSLSKKIKINNF